LHGKKKRTRAKCTATMTSTRNVRVRDLVNTARAGENRRLTSRPVLHVERRTFRFIERRPSTFTRATIALALFKRTCSRATPTVPRRGESARRS